MNQNRFTPLNARTIAPPLTGSSGTRFGTAAMPPATVGIACKVEQSIAYMTEHLNEPLQVATLAAMANVSASHFFALFKKRTGFPPMDYFTRLRMRHAGRLLDTTPASVKEVAAALGYDDPFYFSRVFKSVHQIPPSRYRTTRRWLGDGQSPVGMAGTRA